MNKFRVAMRSLVKFHGVNVATWAKSVDRERHLQY